MTDSLRCLLIIAGSAWLIACTKDSAPPAIRRKDSQKPFEHVVLILIDTLRADVVHNADTPNLDALAASGGRVDRAWSSGTWTAPSIVSLFTGSPIRAHGWDLPAGHIGKYPALPDRPTLAEKLHGAGFTTTALVGNPYLTKALGFDRGFDHWTKTTDTAMLRSLQRSFLPKLKTGGRHFLYLHLMGPHSPLLPSSEAQARRGLDPSWFTEPRGLKIGAAKRNRLPGVRGVYAEAYRAVVEDTDQRLGQILSALQPLGTDTLYIVTSDHGELLGEHDVVGHGRHLWEPLTHVPLVVGGVSGLPDRLSIDAIPDLVTRLTAVEAQWPSQAAPGRALVSQREGDLAMSPDGRTKWIWRDSQLNGYDLTKDPGEESVLPPNPGASDLRQAWFTEVPSGPILPLIHDLAPSTKSALQALGYAD
jgi:hypothetical protein